MNKNFYCAIAFMLEKQYNKTLYLFNRAPIYPNIEIFFSI